MDRKAFIFILFPMILFAMGCSKQERRDDPDSDIVYLSIAEVNTDALAAQSGQPASRVTASGNQTVFTDGDVMGLFLFGDQYDTIHNRPVTLNYPNGKKWEISGHEIALHTHQAVATGYFPYSSQNTVKNVLLFPGLYDVATNDLVWKQDAVWNKNPEAKFIGMRHALTRVKFSIKKSAAATGGYPGAGKVTLVQVVDTTGTPASEKVIFINGKLDFTATPIAATGLLAGGVMTNAEKTLSSTTATLYDFLLLPVPGIKKSQILLKITVDDKVVFGSIPVGGSYPDKWEAGTAYTYNVIVQNGQAQIVFGRAGVSSWTDGDDILGELETSGPQYDGGDVDDWTDKPWNDTQVDVK